MKKSIKKFADNDFPIYAECCGLMYLTKSITNDKKKYKIVGLIDAETIMTKKMRLNYTKGKFSSQNILSNTLHGFRGH